MLPRLPERGLTVEVDATDDEQSAVVRLAGELCLREAPRLRDQFRGMIAAGTRHLVIDLEGCVFLDSAGLAVLVNVRRGLRASGGDVVLRTPSRAAYRALALTGLRRTFRIEQPPALWNGGPAVVTSSRV